MFSDSLRLLRERLETRRIRLLETKFDDFYFALKRVWEFIHSQVGLKGILAELQQRRSIAQYILGCVTMTGHRDDYCRPKTVLEEAVHAYHLIESVIPSDYHYGKLLLFYKVSGTDLSNIKNNLIHPLFDYLDEALDEKQVLLGHLIRYAQRCECFDRRRIADSVQKYSTEATVRGGRKAVEAFLKEGLYTYLHDQGVDFVIEPYSQGGEIDLIADQMGEGKKYIEVKVFDDQNRDKGYLKDGFRQLLTYLHQYKASTGYLAVYKLCEQHLAFDLDGTVQSIPFVIVDGKTIYIVVIDVYPYNKSVSQRGPLISVQITRQDLVKTVST
jgi:hypothetical protein